MGISHIAAISNVNKQGCAIYIKAIFICKFFSIYNTIRFLKRIIGGIKNLVNTR